MNRKWWIIGGIVLILGCGVCSVIGLVIMMGSTTTTSSAGDINNDAPEQAYQIGQDVIVGDVRWKVLTVENLGSELRSENQFIDPLGTAGRFIKVQVEVENRATEARTFAEGDILDSQGRTFNDSSDAFFFIEDNERCVLENLNPNLPRVCTAIYEVPADAAGLKLVVGDLSLFSGDEGQIDLGQ